MYLVNMMFQINLIYSQEDILPLVNSMSISGGLGPQVTVNGNEDSQNYQQMADSVNPGALNGGMGCMDIVPVRDGADSSDDCMVRLYVNYNYVPSGVQVLPLPASHISYL